MRRSRSLRRVDDALGCVPPRSSRRRTARAYDMGGAIELRYSGALGAEPVPAPPVLQPSPRMPLPVMPALPPVAPGPPPVAPALPPSAPAPPPVAPAPAPTLQAPLPPAAPGPLPPSAAEPYTSDDDDRAVAAAFAEDLRRVLESSRSEEDLGLRDDDGFLEHARATARQAKDLEPDEEEEDEAEAQALSSPPRPARGHAFFDELANATTFAAEPFRVDLSRQFDAFDAEDDAVRRRAAVDPAPGAAVPPAAAAPDAAARERVREVEDISLIEERAADKRFSVRFDVPLIAQQAGVSRWAAAAAMVVAWRDRLTVDAAEIARAGGPWEPYKDVLEREDETVLERWGLEIAPPQAYSTEALRSLLDTYGPLWTAPVMQAGARPFVVTGIEGDGTPAATRVSYHDPSDPGTAAQTTYTEFEAAMAPPGSRDQSVQGITVAHARDRLAPDDPRRSR